MNATHWFWFAWAFLSIAGAVLIVKALETIIAWLDDRWPL